MNDVIITNIEILTPVPDGEVVDYDLLRSYKDNLHQFFNKEIDEDANVSIKVSHGDKFLD